MAGGKILITGAGGCIGQHLKKSLRDNGHSLVVASSRPGMQDKEDVTYFHANFADKKTHDPAFWEQKIEENGVGVVVNLAGGAYAPFGGSLSDINLHPVTAMAQASANTGAHLLQVSSMATMKVFPTDETEYSKTKHEAEEQIRDRTKDYTIIRPDLVFADKSTVSMRHSFSPDEMATLPGPTIVLGRGQQTIQPVGIGDTVQGLQSIAENPEENKGKNINFVGPEIISQIGLVSMLKEARGEKIFPARIGFDSYAAKYLQELAQKEPMGSFNASMLGALESGEKKSSVAGFDNRPFRELLGGKELTKLTDVLERDQLKFVKPPMGELVRRIVQNPSAMASGVKFAVAAAPTLANAMTQGGKQYLKNGLERKKPVDVLVKNSADLAQRTR